MSHAEVGFWAAEIWNLDETLAHAIRHHHGPAESRPADIVNLAYVITQAERVGSPGDTMMAHLLPGLFRRLAIDDLALDHLLGQLVRVYDALEPLFSSVAC